MKKLIIGLLIGTVLTSFVLTVTGYIDLRNAIAQARSTIIELAYTLAGEAINDDVIKVEMRGYYVSITSATTTVLKSGPGWLQGCTILGGTPGTIKIYDNTTSSGAVIADTFTPPAGIWNIPLNASFSIGVTIVTGSAMVITCTVR
jgi:hypothetical protein